MNNRVVITGMGIYSCIGSNLKEVRESLYEGKSGIVFDEERKEYGFQSALTGKVPLPDLKKALSRRQRITIGEETEYAYIATMEALQNAGIDLEDFNKREIDRKSTRLNSSHVRISYAVFCLKKKRKIISKKTLLIVVFEPSVVLFSYAIQNRDS